MKITYKMISEYVEKKYGFKVHTAYIAEMNGSLGLTMHDAPNVVRELKHMIFIFRWLKMFVAGKSRRINYHICLIIYWILHVMKKSWDYIKKYVKNIYVHIQVVLSFTLKRIGICGKMKTVI